ncbi:hypothetical protein [Bacillus cereus]|uniref:hypothetical protein n=1 Tax=Bacillus cereus TaxID=1396 RepID=UPI000BFB4F4A|nr:hypothetical protein [Bacillus cereus]PGR83576.1 hypothetical protein COC63_06215 [Bacillus cereus]
MEFKREVRYGKTGYDVIIDGEVAGFVFKEKGVGNAEMWKIAGREYQYGTRKRAGEDVVIRYRSEKEGSNVVREVMAIELRDYLNRLMAKANSIVRFSMVERSGRPVFVINVPDDKYIKRSNLTLTQDFYDVLNKALEDKLGTAEVNYDNYRQSFWSKHIVWRV